MTTIFKAGFGCWQPRMLHGRLFLRCDGGMTKPIFDGSGGCSEVFRRL